MRRGMTMTRLIVKSIPRFAHKAGWARIEHDGSKFWLPPTDRQLEKFSIYLAEYIVEQCSIKCAEVIEKMYAKRGEQFDKEGLSRAWRDDDEFKPFIRIIVGMADNIYGSRPSVLDLEKLDKGAAK